MKPYFTLLALAASSPFVSGSTVGPRQSTPIPPSQDPFYQPDAGFESTPPGTILRYRKLDKPWSTSVATHQLLLRSTDSNGRPDAVVTTILEPASADPSKLVASQITSDSAWVDCSQSYLLQAGAGEYAKPPDHDFVLTSALAEGWYVSVPDYLGFNASFTNGVQEGQASLDSLRAALASTNITGLAPDATMVIFGYSGGAVAAGFATELQPRYAPELKIAGAALGGIAPNVTATYIMVNKASSAAISPVGLLGLSAQDPTFRAHIESLLYPQNASMFNYALSHCGSAQGEALFAYQDISSYFTVGDNILRDPMVVDFVNRFGNMGCHDTPEVPLYLFKGTLDESSDIRDADALVDKYCANGADIEYVRNEDIDHEYEGLVGQEGAWDWLKDRLNGVPIAKGCNVTTVPKEEASLPPLPPDWFEP